MPADDPRQIDLLIGPAVLSLLGGGTTSVELAREVSGTGLTVSAERAGAILEQLSQLGLVRVIAHGPDGPRHVATTLGQRLAEAHLAGGSDLALGLEELERLRTDLLSTIAHELRTPLTALRTCVGLLLDPTLRPSPDERQRLLATIARSSDRMYRLLEELLELARYRAGKVRLQRRRFDARALARDAVAAVGPLAEAAGQAISLEAPRDAVPVYADRRRLEQALLNLVSNAQKFSARGAEVLVTVRDDGDVVRWDVEDHGPGIAADDQARLFERFFVGVSDAHGGGAGLGLPTALAIAQAHGGEIEVDSVVGRGSRFSLVVPREAGPHGDEA